MSVQPGVCRIALIGMMGSGKSTIGRLLGQRTGWPYHDNDELLEGARGLSARELLAAGGEGMLRGAEADALNLALVQSAPCIVSAGAGTILGPDSRARLAAAAIVIWLRADPLTLATRAAGAEHRPWLEQDQAQTWMRDNVAARTPLYESVADLVLDTADRPPAEVVDDILEWLRGLDACRAWLPES